MVSFATIAEMSDIADHATTVTLGKLDECVISMAEQKIICTIKNCDFDHSKVFVCQAIQSSLRDLLVSTLEDGTRVCDAFKAGVFQVVETRNM